MRRVCSTFVLTALGLVLVSGAGVAASNHADAAIVRVAYRAGDLDSLDPALSYNVPSFLLLDPTCALLLRPGRQWSSLHPEVAASLPRVSRDRKMYAFTLRSGFRFSDGSTVDAHAFAHAIDRMLAPQMKSPWAPYLRDIVGAKKVLAGNVTSASGVVARGRLLVIHLERPIPDFAARTTFLCAVPPNLPVDREGVAVFPAAGPYYIAEYRPGDAVALRRNAFYGGPRPHHVDGFEVDLDASSQEEVVDRVESGQADWGWALPQVFFDPARQLAKRFGVNKEQFFVQPGTTFRGYAFNAARALFKDNPQLRRAVSFAIDRSALRRAAGGPLSSRLTDQYLPPGMPGFRNASIYPFTHPDLRRARQLARGHTRSGNAVLYAPDLPNHIAFAQSVKQNLKKIGLDVRIKAIPLLAYFGGLMQHGPYDLGFVTWAPDYADPYAILNVQLDGRFAGTTNPSRFDSARFNRLLRAAAALRVGAARSRAYAKLDVRLAREAAPMVAVDFFTNAALVSKRLGCVRQPFDLAAICLRSS
jgi:peptide/nickel transport system substrate-binding protein